MHQLPRTSVVCCHTGLDKLAYLTNSLDAQDLNCERVFLDNSMARFSSAAAALNAGAAKATGELLVFVHQDVRFKDSQALDNLTTACWQNLHDGDVGGIAGAIVYQGRKQLITCITHSSEELPYPDAIAPTHPCQEVESLDECAIIMTKRTWEARGFDEDICNSWHLYAVERCLAARRCGGRALVFGARANHLSQAGTLDQAYFNTLRRLMRRYANSFDHVATTIGVWPQERLRLERAILDKRMRRAYGKLMSKRG